jgi:hypothetical protein
MVRSSALDRKSLQSAGTASMTNPPPRSGNDFWHRCSRCTNGSKNSLYLSIHLFERPFNRGCCALSSCRNRTVCLVDRPRRADVQLDPRRLLDRLIVFHTTLTQQGAYARCNLRGAEHRFFCASLRDIVANALPGAKCGVPGWWPTAIIDKSKLCDDLHYRPPNYPSGTQLGGQIVVMRPHPIVEPFIRRAGGSEQNLDLVSSCHGCQARCLIAPPSNWQGNMAAGRRCELGQLTGRSGAMERSRFLIRPRHPWCGPVELKSIGERQKRK